MTMAPGHSTLRRSEREIRMMDAKKAELGIPPAVDFWSPVKKEEDSKEYDKNKDHYVSIDIPLGISTETY